MLVNAVSVEQEETKQAVFVAVEKFLFGSLARAEFDAPESDAEIEDAGPRVLYQRLLIETQLGDSQTLKSLNQYREPKQEVHDGSGSHFTSGFRWS